MTTTVTVAFCMGPRTPTLQTTVANPCVQLPVLGFAETSEDPPGRMSVTVTPVALDGPALATSYV